MVFSHVFSATIFGAKLLGQNPHTALKQIPMRTSRRPLAYHGIPAYHLNLAALYGMILFFISQLPDGISGMG